MAIEKIIDSNHLSFIHGVAIHKSPPDARIAIAMPPRTRIIIQSDDAST